MTVFDSGGLWTLVQIKRDESLRVIERDRLAITLLIRPLFSGRLTRIRTGRLSPSIRSPQWPPLRAVSLIWHRDNVTRRPRASTG